MLRRLLDFLGPSFCVATLKVVSRKVYFSTFSKHMRMKHRLILWGYRKTLWSGVEAWRLFWQSVPSITGIWRRVRTIFSANGLAGAEIEWPIGLSCCYVFFPEKVPNDFDANVLSALVRFT